MNNNPLCVNELERQRSGNKDRRSAVDSAMTLVGGIAALSSVPQVIKIWETGDISGISLATYLISFFTVLAWLLYGIYIKNKPLVVTSLLSTMVLGTVILQILTFS